MMQSAQAGLRNNSLYPATLLGGTSVGRLLPKAEMRAVLVVIAYIFGQKSLQVALVERNDMIEQVPAATSHPALRDSILPWTLERSTNWLAAEGANRRRHF